MFRIFKTNKLTSVESVDIIENLVYEYLKPLGFKKHGRTLHRFVDNDISQVVNLQNGCPSKRVYDTLWVNIGIRVPECAEHKFTIDEPLKKYYHEYECNIRTQLGLFADGKDTGYSLKKDPDKIGEDIVERLKKYVIPVFDVLNSRDAILKHRAEYPLFDQFNSNLILLEQAMIVGRRGDFSEAARLFNAYYQAVLEEYNYILEHGIKTYLKKGERMIYLNEKTNETETITAVRSGYVTTYDTNKHHITYLEELAQELGITLCTLASSERGCVRL